MCDQLDVPSEYKIDHKFFLICHVAQEVPKANVYMQLFKLEPRCMTTEVVPQGQTCGTDTGAGTKMGRGLFCIHILRLTQHKYVSLLVHMRRTYKFHSLRHPIS